MGGGGSPPLVLSTCWPFDALTPGPERYLVHATMVVGASRILTEE